MNSNLFKGSRIQLTALCEADAESFAHWSGDGEYLRNLDTDYAVPHDEVFYKEQIQSAASDSHIIEFGIRVLEEDVLIGFISLHSIEWNNGAASLAVGIGASDFRGKGLGSEAIKLVLNYAFHELNLNRVGLDVIGNNKNAVSCYEKCGFIVEGTVRQAVLRDGQAYDRIYMGVLKNEWYSHLTDIVQ